MARPRPARACTLALLCSVVPEPAALLSGSPDLWLLLPGRPCKACGGPRPPAPPALCWGWPSGVGLVRGHTTASAGKVCSLRCPVLSPEDLALSYVQSPTRM